MQIYRLNIDVTITGSEPFPGEMMPPRKDRVSLPDDIYELLVQYYNNAYNWNFVTIADAASRDITEDFIVVLPNVNQYGRIRIGAEIFGAAIAARYLRNSHVLAKFIQDNEEIELWPGVVQFFFEHSIKLPTGTKSHHLAFVKWHLQAPNRQTRFTCQIGGNDDKVCNFELWENKFHETERDSIIPVHNIYSRFIPSKFIVGVRNPKEYMGVIPINRQFHL
jgi:hypothetical protein